MTTSIFPLIKKFEDVRSSSNTVILMHESIIHSRCFRSGTVFSILGWREIGGHPFIILNKGSWEGLVPYSVFSENFENL
jgi:hypothetical protein